MTDKRYCLTIDQGTTGTKCLIIDHEGNKVAWKYSEHQQIYPRPGWVEHDPIEIIEKTCNVMNAALKEARIRSDEIAAIGVTNQRETTMLWNPKTGRPYYNAIVWQCTRTKDICDSLREHDDFIQKRTGLFSSTYFSGPKIKWILDNVPGIREKVEKEMVYFGNIDSWLIWWLTGGPKKGAHVTDYTNGSRTMLMNIKKLVWDKEMLGLLGIPESILPALRPSSDKEIYGYTQVDGILGAAIPVCGDLGDQQAALVGQACFREGEVKNTYGTGCFILSTTGEEPRFSKNRLLTTVAFSLERNRCCYALEGSIAIAGSAIQWLRDNLKLIKSSSETEKIAESISEEGSGGIYFVPAFSGLYAPFWDSNARGVICGLTRFVKREHLVHATLESICWQTRDVFEAMVNDSNMRLEALKVDGGASVNNYLMQLQASILGCNVVRPKFTETTSLGAAYAAGVAVGFWKDLNELRKLWAVDRIFEPKWSKEKSDHLYKGWKESVKLTMGWLKKIA